MIAGWVLSGFLHLATGANVLDSVRGAMGVTAHFFYTRPGELQAFRSAGLTWVRREMNWMDIERERGVYRFRDWDKVVDSLTAHGIRIVFLMGYGNKLYDQGRSPATPEAIEAYANWVAAAVARYRGRGIVWEIWNEPNWHFWTPKPDVDAYLRLLAATARKARAADPGVVLLGPAQAGSDTAYADSCVRRGILEHIDGYSLHPYRTSNPESLEPELASLRRILSRGGRKVPVVVTEWGYSTGDAAVPPRTQARFLARMRLFALVEDLPILFWYDWMDNGEDSLERENRYGMMGHNVDFRKEILHKPVLLAQVQVSKVLQGAKLVRRQTVDTATRVVELARGGARALVVWRFAPGEPSLVMSLPGTIRCLDMTGQTCRNFRHRKGGTFELIPTPEPSYILQSGY